MMRLHTALLAAVILFIGSAEAFAVCRLPFFRTPNGGTGEGTMTVSSGEQCKFGTYPLNSDSISFSQRPRNGTVTIPSAGIIVYQSRKGFVGEDSFSYTHSGYDDFRTKVVRRARVTVTVTP